MLQYYSIFHIKYSADNIQKNKVTIAFPFLFYIINASCESLLRFSSFFREVRSKLNIKFACTKKSIDLFDQNEPKHYSQYHLRATFA